RSPINFADTLMEQAKSAVERVYTCIENLEFLKENAEDTPCTDEFKSKLDGYRKKFCDAMDDDLNTADAIAAIFDIVYMANTDITSASGKGAIDAVLSLIRELGAVLGLFTKEKNNSLDTEVEELIRQRNEARAAKDWATADAIRDKLKEMNIVLKDTPDGVKWSIVE
ncbi:MAG: DALR domain-containing protein, partial [Clostridia bacterium]|nr:DALR domain-containing protein [Clostridia bacterium]